MGSDEIHFITSLAHPASLSHRRIMLNGPVVSQVRDANAKSSICLRPNWVAQIRLSVGFTESNRLPAVSLYNVTKAWTFRVSQHERSGKCSLATRKKM